MSAILRKRLTRGWTGVPNASIRDTEISFRATGLLAFLLSMEDGWSMDSAVIAERKGHEGREAVRNALRELRMAGYMRHTKTRVMGRFTTEVEVSDVPVDEWKGGKLLDLTTRLEPDTNDGFSGAGTNDGFSGPGGDLTNDGFSGAGVPASGSPQVGGLGGKEKTLRRPLKTDGGVGDPLALHVEPQAQDDQHATRHDLDRRGAQLVGELAVRLAQHLDDATVARFYAPWDAGCRTVLARRLAELEANGWPAATLAVELAGIVHDPDRLNSIAGLILDRARELEDRPVVARATAAAEPVRADLAGERRLAAAAHGATLARTGLTADEVRYELAQAYSGARHADELEAAFTGAGIPLDASSEASA